MADESSKTLDVNPYASLIDKFRDGIKCTTCSGHMVYLCSHTSMCSEHLDALCSCKPVCNEHMHYLCSHTSNTEQTYDKDTTDATYPCVIEIRFECTICENIGLVALQKNENMFHWAVGYTQPRIPSSTPLVVF
jgi:hypothetical protein